MERPPTTTILLLWILPSILVVALVPLRIQWALGKETLLALCLKRLNRNQWIASLLSLVKLHTRQEHSEAQKRSGEHAFLTRPKSKHTQVWSKPSPSSNASFSIAPMLPCQTNLATKRQPWPLKTDREPFTWSRFHEV